MIPVKIYYKWNLFCYSSPLSQQLPTTARIYIYCYCFSFPVCCPRPRAEIYIFPLKYISVYISSVCRCISVRIWMCVYIYKTLVSRECLPSHLPNFFHVHYCAFPSSSADKVSHVWYFPLKTLNVSIYCYCLIIQSIINQFIEYINIPCVRFQQQHIKYIFVTDAQFFILLNQVLPL